MQVDRADDVALSLREFTLAKYGKFRGQSLVVEAAIRDYLKKKDATDGTFA